AHAQAGNISQAEALLEEMTSFATRRYVSPYHLALVNCGMGRTEAALDLLDQAYEQKDAKVLWSGVDPELESLHGHPRFIELLRKLNHRLAALPLLSSQSHADQKSIAVLPFRVLTVPAENTGDEYLG